MTIPLQLNYLSKESEKEVDQKEGTLSQEEESIECELCFEVPNRAKELPCCRQNVICSLCARAWLAKHRSCPFCRRHLSSQVRHLGIADSAVQKVVDTLNVACPFSVASCPWTGRRDQLPSHLSNECVVAKEPTSNIPNIADFALDEKWYYVDRRSRRFSTASDSVHSQTAIDIPQRAISARSSLVHDRAMSDQLSAVGSAVGLVRDRSTGAAGTQEDDGSETGSEAERINQERERALHDHTPLWEQVQSYVMTPEEVEARQRRRELAAQQLEADQVEQTWLQRKRSMLIGLGIIALLIILTIVGYYLKSR
ncbi:hypothetical protein HDU99_000382 [Rhizoclosmatium hyalinum]|nr:hypothetical protein HDU99_000382 [Rhizoclosmatium hyalinum]